MNAHGEKTRQLNASRSEIAGGDLNNKLFEKIASNLKKTRDYSLEREVPNFDGNALWHANVKRKFIANRVKISRTGLAIREKPSGLMTDRRCATHSPRAQTVGRHRSEFLVTDTSGMSDGERKFWFER